MKRFLFLLFISIHSISTFGQTYVLDSLFNGNGRKRLGVGYYSEMSDCLVQSDNKVVIVSRFRNNPNNLLKLLFTRINQDGTIDLSFGANGNGYTSLDINFNNEGLVIPQLTFDSNNRIIVVCAAQAALTASVDFFVCRLTSSGTVDNTFNSTGSLFVDLIGSNTFNDYAFDVDIDTSGNIYVAGAVMMTSSNIQLGIIKIKENGSLDSTFNLNGRMVMDLLPNISEAARKIKVQPDGKILIGVDEGLFLPFSTSYCYLYRIDSLGNLDSTFNGTGVLPLSFGPPCYFSSMAIDLTSNIVVAANTTLPSSIGVKRILPSGILDSTFGIGGSIALKLNNNISAVGDLRIVNGNQILLCGLFREANNLYKAGIVRVSEVGILDTSFNSTGYFLDQFDDYNGGSNADHVYALGLLNNGGIFVGGGYKWFPPNAWSYGIGMMMIKPQTPTGIQSIDGNKQLVLFPNPARNNLTLRITDDLNIIVMDVLGKTLLHSRLQKGDNELNIQSLNPGLYFIVDTNSNLKLKFIKE